MSTRKSYLLLGTYRLLKYPRKRIGRSRNGDRP